MYIARLISAAFESRGPRMADFGAADIKMIYKNEYLSPEFGD